MKKIGSYCPEERTKWLELIELLQNEFKLDVYPGGYTAMINWYHQHDIRFKYTFEYLYGKDVSKIPKKLLEDKKWERSFELVETIHFPKEVGMEQVNTFDYIITIPSQERALLEMVARIGITSNMDSVFEFYTDLAGCLDAKNYQKLLEYCNSERVRRVGLFLAEESGSICSSELDLAKIPLNLKNNQDYSFNEDSANHIIKYNMQVPAQLSVEICKYLPNELKEYYEENKMPVVAF